MYDYQDVCDRIDFLRLEPSEFVEKFLNRFLQLCCEFLKGVIDSDFIIENFQNLILLSLRSFESEPLDDSLSPTFTNHRIPQFSKEEPIIPFVPCHPHLKVPIWVPPSDDIKVERSKNQTIDLCIQPPSNSYDLHITEENLEFFSNCMDLEVKVDPSSFQGHIKVNVSNLESNPNENPIVYGDILKPLPSMFHDSLIHDPLVSPASPLTIFNMSFQAIIENKVVLFHMQRRKVLKICFIFPPLLR